MALLSLDRHDVLESIRQSKDLHDAFLRVAKLIAYDAEVVEVIDIDDAPAITESE